MLPGTHTPQSAHADSSHETPCLEFDAGSRLVTEKVGKSFTEQESLNILCQDEEVVDGSGRAGESVRLCVKRMLKSAKF